MTRPLRVLDLYAGAGGFSEGIRLAQGFDVVVAVENDADAAETLRANHPETNVVECDVRETTSDELLELADGPIDVVIGGPPCQGFSLKGQRSPEHESADLLFEFARLVEELQPAAFLLENVPGLLSFRRGIVIDQLVRRLNQAAGEGHTYNTVLDTVDAAGFGVPQHRRRVFVCGLFDSVFQFPAPSSTRVTLREAIGDLPEWTAEDADEAIALPPSNPLTAYQRARRGRCRKLYNHTSKKLEELRMARLAELQEGDDRRALPEHLQAGGHEGKYRRLRSSAPSPTVMAHMAKDTSDFIHPNYERMVTVREAARLQSFDDRYRFCGSQYQQFRQVGNAVPPLLAMHLGRAVELPARRAIRALTGAYGDADTDAVGLATA